MRRRLAEAEIRESTEMAFEVYGQHIKAVPRFTYLGRVMTAEDDDWTAVAGNMAKARKSWGRMQGVLRRQNTVAQYIATRPLLDLCVGARAREGAKVTLRWWEQVLA